MQYQKIIEQLGYSRKEAKVYLTALKMGESHISDIADKVKMPRSTVQVIADRLHADGLMNFYVMRRYKYWVAANPEILLKSLQEKEKLVEEAIPALVEMRKMARRKNTKQKPIHKIQQVFTCVSCGLLPMLVADEDGIIQHVNKKWIDLFGYQYDEVVGKHTRLLASGQTPDEVYENLWRILKRHGLYQTDEVIDMKKDGSTFTMKATFFTLEHGRRIYFVQILDETDV